jgi:hypothetical protein
MECRRAQSGRTERSNRIGELRRADAEREGVEHVAAAELEARPASTKHLHAPAASPAKQ